MAYTARPTETTHTSDAPWHAITALFAVIGVVAAALGAWMEWGPTDGTLNLFGWTWNVADLSSLWAPFLMIAGGVIASLSMGVESIRDWTSQGNRWLVSLEALITVAGVAAVIVGIVLLF